MQICKFFADSKSRAQELSNDVSFVIFEHKKWDLEGGGQIDPPSSTSWFSSTPAEIGLKCLFFRHLQGIWEYLIQSLYFKPRLFYVRELF